MDDRFLQQMIAGYTFDEPSLVLGALMLDGEVARRRAGAVPLSDGEPARAGRRATGTGKTKTCRSRGAALRCRCSRVVSDVKGDLTGISQPGDATAASDQASRTAGHDLRAEAHPVELLSLSGQLGAHVRATVSSLGPILLGKVLAA